jgi:hypothetical protein
MKTNFTQNLKSNFFLTIILAFFFLNAQAIFSPPDGSPINYIITNVTQVNDRTLEFDLFLKNTDSANPLELSIIQAGILVNSEIVNGGKVTSMVVPGFSDLVSSQQPTTTIFVKGQTNSIIKLAAKIGPGAGNGTKISTTGKGTRVCRLRLTNTVPFAKAKANLSFCFTLTPYPTRVFQYVGRMSAQLIVNSSNCFRDAPDPVLNE